STPNMCLVAHLLYVLARLGLNEKEMHAFTVGQRLRYGDDLEVAIVPFMGGVDLYADSWRRYL
ncbi:hypothetical protein AAIH64_14215, partial [Pseudomonas aeruginosa]|uniref:hypothetical protein n=1 Tax=Pseudomonas aeruginosa TaxID=287 RepID=UPI0031B6B979